MVAGKPVAVQSPASARFGQRVRAAGRRRSCSGVAAKVARFSFTTRQGGMASGRRSTARTSCQTSAASASAGASARRLPALMVTLTTPGQAGPPAVYQQLNATITNLTPKSFSPFSVSAQLPGGGSLSANGKAGPFDQVNSAATPIDAQISLKHVELETSGVLAPDAGINGMTNLDAKVQSNGQTLNASGTAHVDGIKLAKNGRPSAKPVEVQFTIAQDERAMTGTIQRATIGIGGVAINVSGTYQTSGPTTALNLKVNGNAMSINELEAFLPALGVTLPQGSRLQGGTITTNMTVSGSSARPTISGPVEVNNTQLAGFDLVRSCRRSRSSLVDGSGRRRGRERM